MSGAMDHRAAGPLTAVGAELFVALCVPGQPLPVEELLTPDLERFQEQLVEMMQASVMSEHR